MMYPSMEQKSYNTLPFKTISEVSSELLKYVTLRKEGKIKSLKTKWEKFNKMCNGGIEPGCVYTIVGASGSGKSAFANCLQIDLVENNPDVDVVILAFSFEMIGYRQIGRILSNKLYQTTNEIYSTDVPLSENDYQKVVTVTDKISKYPVYYVEEISTVNRVAETISYFQNTIAKDKWLVVLLDHTLLVDGYNDERKTISELEKVFIKLKKVGRTSIIQLSQMNRNIEMPERIMNPTSHYPMRSDISSSDSIFQASDVIAVLSRPEILGIREYGVNKLPTYNKIYLHFLKVREGKLAILDYDNDLAHNRFIEN